MTSARGMLATYCSTEGLIRRVAFQGDCYKTLAAPRSPQSQLNETLFSQTKEGYNVALSLIHALDSSQMDRGEVTRAEWNHAKRGRYEVSDLDTKSRPRYCATERRGYRPALVAPRSSQVEVSLHESFAARSIAKMSTRVTEARTGHQPLTPSRHAQPGCTF